MNGQRGAGLVEVMVAFAVFGVGVAGVVSTQLSARKASYEALQQSIATDLARDILERMRGNPAVLAAYEVDAYTGDSGSVPPDCSPSGCSAQQRAALDLSEWGRGLAGQTETLLVDGVEQASGGLLEPLACISHRDGVVTVAIVWQRAGESSVAPAPGCGEVAAKGSPRARHISLTSYIRAIR